MVKRTILNKRSRSTKKEPVQRRTSRRKRRSNRKSAKFVSPKNRKSFQRLVDVPKIVTPIKTLDEKTESLMEASKNNVKSDSVIEISDDESELPTSLSTSIDNNKFEESCFIIDVQPGIDEWNKSKSCCFFKDGPSCENNDNGTSEITDIVVPNSSTNQPSTSNLSSIQYTYSENREKLEYSSQDFVNGYQGRLNSFLNNNWKIFKRNLNQSKNTTNSNNSVMEVLNVSDISSTNDLNYQRLIPSYSLDNRQMHNAVRSLRSSTRVSCLRYINTTSDSSVQCPLLNIDGVDQIEANSLKKNTILFPDDCGSSVSSTEPKSNFKRKHSHQLNIALQKTRKLRSSNKEGLDNATSASFNTNINTLDSLDNWKSQESSESSSLENLSSSDNSNSNENETLCASSSNIVNSNDNAIKETPDKAISIDSDSDIEFVNEYNPSNQFIELSDSENHVPVEIPLPKTMKSQAKRKPGAKKAASKKKAAKKSLKKNKTKEKTSEKKLIGRPRPIVIDGCNVGMGHSRSKMLSVKGIQICCEYFVKRGHDIKVFLPSYKKYHPLTTDCPALNDMEREGTLILTPGRKVAGKYISSYDDRFIVEYASIKGAIVITRDNYRDLYEEREDFRDTIRNRLLQYTFVDDLIMFPSDPLGRQGPHLDEFLRFPPDQEQGKSTS